jgi:zinc transport system substrate-binding protein
MHPALAAALLASAVAAAPATAEPSVAVDVLPVQSIVARVMQGVASPALIVPPGASPHGYAMRPSEARLLQDADLVFWVGPGLTPWLADAIATLATGATIVELDAAEGLTLLDRREGGDFEATAHADHDHSRDAPDAHIWLDPGNGVAMARAAAAALAQVDPANAATYRANEAEFAAEMAALEAEISELLEPAAGGGYVVFHDAYQYFETGFGLPAAGAISLSDADQPSAARVAGIRSRLERGDIACVFSEPQFTPKLITTLLEGADVRSGTLDPIGASLPPGPDLYPDLLRNLADDLLACLTPSPPA